MDEYFGTRACPDPLNRDIREAQCWLCSQCTHQRNTGLIFLAADAKSVVASVICAVAGNLEHLIPCRPILDLGTQDGVVNVSVCAHTAACQNRAPCHRTCPIAVFRCPAHHELESPLVPMSSQGCLKGESVPLALTDVTLNSEGRVWNERRYSWATICGDVPLCILTCLADGVLPFI